MLDEQMPLASSFRDPDGYLYTHEDELYRQINQRYFSTYQHLMRSGLYNRLTSESKLISHREIQSDEQCLKIKPTVIPFISYPYEWCFSQLKEAALLTLKIQKSALEHNMSLKDASAYNVQFYQGVAIFIDTLSFEMYQENSPWVAYRQFCQHFLAPLLLMAYTDIRLNQLMRVYIDGVPLDLCSTLLPAKTWLNFSALLHIHLHAKMQKKHQHSEISATSKQSFKLNALKYFIDNLIKTVEKIQWKIDKSSTWFDYYTANNNYSPISLSQKEMIVNDWVKDLKPKMLWDLGANTGRFSFISAHHAKNVVAWDMDISCIESLNGQIKNNDYRNILPLVQDLTNPTPSLGWANQERDSFGSRGPVSTILALGLIHHITISNHVPFANSAQFFAKLCVDLIIEYIPIDDSQVIKLLNGRKEQFADYTLENFIAAYSTYFYQIESQALETGNRILLLFKNKRSPTIGE